MGVSRGTYEHGGNARSRALARGERPTVASQPGPDGLVPLPDARTTFLVLSLAALALFIVTQVSIALDYESDLLLRFDTGFEANVATWFSSALWLAAAGLAFALGGAARRLAHPSR